LELTMPKTRTNRTGTMWMLSALAVGLVAAGCGKDMGGGGGSGGAGGINPARNDASTRGGTGGSSTGSGGTGNTGSGGSTGGSTAPGTGGSGAGGSGAGGSGSAGDGGPAANFNPPPGMAVGKFCNELAGPMNMILEFSVEVGMAPVKLTAKSGECFPPAPMKCLPLPVGMATIKVFNTADTTMPVVDTTGMIPDASQMMFMATVDEATQRAVFRSAQIKPEFDCAQITFDSGPPPDGGVPPTGPGPRPPLMP
jgi:hypothetical protein